MYCKEGKYDKVVEMYGCGVKSVVEWEDDMYLMKFCFIYELYFGSGDWNVFKECFDLLEFCQFFVDVEDLLYDIVECFNQQECYEFVVFFYCRLMNIKKKLVEQCF